MSGDYTRFTFQPRKRFAAVQMQQGRVQLDSDWNEQADLGRERVRLLGLDVGGEAWVAWLTTPNAFLVGNLAGPPANLSLGDGRIYVDGRLAEIFPGEGVTYLTQPFLPAPPAHNPAIDTIVYLDLWEREVSWAEDPGLLDVALGGIDTTTRVQQIWQVKLHALPNGGAACGIDLDALFPPSGGRLTTSANAPPAPDDPCILPPNSGYRGIENRLYRIEVQTPGVLGTARFKWSRDNGSIMSRVSAIAVAGGKTRVTVNRIGRDAVLRFRINDWVTLTDDHRELNGEAGQMARVEDIDEAANVITLDRAVPTAGRPFGANAAEVGQRHTRLQRWDQQAPLNAVDGDGLMATAVGPILLEDGVEASFSTTPGGQFRIGDYWVFAARTADASVEILTQAAPRGIHHQYMQLAAIPAGGVPTDCRPPAREDGCCTFVIRPGENIQTALDALPAAGGCVCLKSGVHEIAAPLVILGDNVTLHGESMGVVVYNPRGSGVLTIVGGSQNRVHSLTMRQDESGQGPLAMLVATQDCSLTDCRMMNGGTLGTGGVLIVTSEDAAVRDCAISGCAIAVECDQGCRDIAVSGCHIDAPAPNEKLPTTIGLLARDMTGAITIAGNSFQGVVNGIVIDDDVDGMPTSGAERSRITGNRLDLVEPQELVRTWGIAVAGADTIVSENHIVHKGPFVTAIRLAGSGGQAIGNQIISMAKVPGFNIAIIAGHEEEDKYLPLSTITIADNHVRGLQQGIALGGVRLARVTGNLLGGPGTKFGLGMILTECDDCFVGENQIDDAGIGMMVTRGARNSLVENKITRGAGGIAAFGGEAIVIRGCRVVDAEEAGIVAVAITQRCEIVENSVVRCGAVASSFGFGVGIAGMLIFGEWHVESNEVLDTGIAAGGGDNAGAPLALGIWGELILDARIASNSVGYTMGATRPPAAEDRALLMSGMLEYELDFMDGDFVLGFPIQIADNKFVGSGRTALVEIKQYALTDTVIARFERVLFTANYCSHFPGEQRDGAATVHLRGRRLTVANNQVKAVGRLFPSYNLFNRPGPFIGNVSHGPTLGRAIANEFPNPAAAFNQIA